MILTLDSLVRKYVAISILKSKNCRFLLYLCYKESTNLADCQIRKWRITPFLWSGLNCMWLSYLSNPSFLIVIWKSIFSLTQCEILIARRGQQKQNSLNTLVWAFPQLFFFIWQAPIHGIICSFIATTFSL